MRLRRATGALVAWPERWAVHEAHSRAARAQGLLGRRGLADDEGLWLPVRSVHTFGMRFAIGLVWLDDEQGVVRVDEWVRPGRLRTCLAARGGVVEVAAGRGATLAADLAARPTRPGRPRGPRSGCGSRGR